MPATLTSREFNQDTARAKRAAADGPVFVTDRGKPTHVLLTMAEYQRLAGPRMTVAEAFHWDGASDGELPLPKRTVDPERQIDWGDI
jgi:prevent-host-death family protein